MSTARRRPASISATTANNSALAFRPRARSVEHPEVVVGRIEDAGQRGRRPRTRHRFDRLRLGNFTNREWVIAPGRLAEAQIAQRRRIPASARLLADVVIGRLMYRALFFLRQTETDRNPFSPLLLPRPLAQRWPCPRRHRMLFPSKPIRVVVHFRPAAPTDNIARLIGQKVSEQAGQPVIIDNRGGAAGNSRFRHSARQSRRAMS